MGIMAQFSYDVVPHKGGWAILVTLGEAGAFPTKQAAYDAAAEFVHKLQFAGLRINIREAGPAKPPTPADRRAG
jgi:hypothetical protein